MECILLSLKFVNCMDTQEYQDTTFKNLTHIYFTLSMYRGTLLQNVNNI